MSNELGALPQLLLGTYNPLLDDKGRLILPAKFRSQLATGLVMTRGQEHCLYLLPTDEFQRMYAKISQASINSRQARDYMRVLMSGASQEIPDKQGRISIPPLLRKYAGLERELAVIGAGTRVEVWDLQAWEQYLQDTEGGYAETAQEVVPDLGF